MISRTVASSSSLGERGKSEPPMIPRTETGELIRRHARHRLLES
jgi:hypothetical protein